MKVSQMIQATTVRLAGGMSALAKILESSPIESQLKEKAQKYLGKDSKPQVKVEFTPGYMNIRLWLDMTKDPQATQDEATELAGILLGPNVAVGPHKMTKGMWVAVLKVKI
jgi:hypothetical protein